MNPEAQYGGVRTPRRGLSRKALLIIGAFVALLFILLLAFSVKSSGTPQQQVAKKFTGSFIKDQKPDAAYALTTTSFQKNTPLSTFKNESARLHALIGTGKFIYKSQETKFGVQIIHLEDKAVNPSYVMTVYVIESNKKSLVSYYEITQ
ncbi:MAG: hypothetical protein JWO47_990 [Candidatus Saccharibacteria bacterium]|nr:hypothetical protein [Candidatus Saccharibacteria bacterium]